MEPARLQRKPAKHEPRVGKQKPHQTSAISSRPLTLHDAHSPILQLGQGGIGPGPLMRYPLPVISSVPGTRLQRDPPQPQILSSEQFVATLPRHYTVAQAIRAVELGFHYASRTPPDFVRARGLLNSVIVWMSTFVTDYNIARMFPGVNWTAAQTLGGGALSAVQSMNRRLGLEARQHPGVPVRGGLWARDLTELRAGRQYLEMLAGEQDPRSSQLLQSIQQGATRTAIIGGAVILGLVLLPIAVEGAILASPYILAEAELMYGAAQSGWLLVLTHPIEATEIAAVTFETLLQFEAFGGTFENYLAGVSTPEGMLQLLANIFHIRMNIQSSRGGSPRTVDVPADVVSVRNNVLTIRPRQTPHITPEARPAAPPVRAVSIPAHVAHEADIIPIERARARRVAAVRPPTEPHQQVQQTPLAATGTGDVSLMVQGPTGPGSGRPIAPLETVAMGSGGRRGGSRPTPQRGSSRGEGSSTDRPSQRTRRTEPDDDEPSRPRRERERRRRAEPSDEDYRDPISGEVREAQQPNNPLPRYNPATGVLEHPVTGTRTETFRSPQEARDHFRLYARPGQGTLEMDLAGAERRGPTRQWPFTTLHIPVYDERNRYAGTIFQNVLGNHTFYTWSRGRH